MNDRDECRWDGQVCGVGDARFTIANDVVQLCAKSPFDRANAAGKGDESAASGQLLHL